MKKREQINEEYKWDLSSYIANDEEIEEIFKIIDKLIKVLPTYKGKLADKEMLHEKLTKYRQDFIKITKLGAYLDNMYNVDNSNTKILSLYQRYETAITKLNQADSYFSPQLYELSDEYLNSLLKDKRFKNFDGIIKEIIKLKPHKINEQTNELLAKMNKFLGNNANIHGIISDSEIEYKDATDSKGKKHKVDNANYHNLLRNKDDKLRRSAFESCLTAYGKLNKTFTELYLKDIELDDFYSKLQNYNNMLEKELLGEDVPKIVFDKVIEHVNKNIPLIKDYIKTFAKHSKIKDFTYCDLFLDNKKSNKVSLDKAKEILLNSLAPLGEEYVSLVKKKLNDKSIDYMPNKNKRSGAYCMNCYDANTVILMNYENNFNSVSTIAHEMGHCINAEYFNSAQPYEKAQISIFAAEMASTVNEILLNIYMQNNGSKADKIYYIRNLLDEVRSTIYRQTLFSEFELFAHEKIEKEEPITYKDLNEYYYNLNKKYYGGACKLPKFMQYEWSIIPHFYNAYYVYCYSSGMITAITLASRILNEKGFNEKYIEFLKNGINKPAIEILKEIGIDLTTDEPYETAFKFISDMLKEYKKLIK